jgi:hypothetical protein
LSRTIAVVIPSSNILKNSTLREPEPCCYSSVAFSF